MNTILQVPIDKDLRDIATVTAQKIGFSSLQEMVRLFIKQIADRKIDFKFETNTVLLSKKNDKRYAKMLEDIKSGKSKTKSFTDIDKMMAYLNS